MGISIQVHFKTELCVLGLAAGNLVISTRLFPCLMRFKSGEDGGNGVLGSQ